jgi:hypothetical protein
VRTGKDWGRLEAEYVTGTMSLREISRNESLSQTTVARMSRERGWQDKREAYRTSLTTKAYDVLADGDALKLAARNMQMLDIGDKVFTLFEKQLPNWQEQIDAGKTPISVRDFKLVAELTRLIIGQPTSRTEERSLGLNLHAFNTDQLERYERASRIAIADEGSGNGVSPTAAEDSGAE